MCSEDITITPWMFSKTDFGNFNANYQPHPNENNFEVFESASTRRPIHGLTLRWHSCDIHIYRIFLLKNFSVDSGQFSHWRSVLHLPTSNHTKLPFTFTPTLVTTSQYVLICIICSILSTSSFNGFRGDRQPETYVTFNTRAHEDGHPHLWQTISVCVGLWYPCKTLNTEKNDTCLRWRWHGATMPTRQMTVSLWVAWQNDGDYLSEWANGMSGKMWESRLTYDNWNVINQLLDLMNIVDRLLHKSCAIQ